VKGVVQVVCYVSRSCTCYSLKKLNICRTERWIYWNWCAAVVPSIAVKNWEVSKSRSLYNFCYSVYVAFKHSSSGFTSSRTRRCTFTLAPRSMPTWSGSRVVAATTTCAELLSEWRFPQLRRVPLLCASHSPRLRADAYSSYFTPTVCCDMLLSRINLTEAALPSGRFCFAGCFAIIPGDEVMLLAIFLLCPACRSVKVGDMFTGVHASGKLVCFAMHSGNVRVVAPNMPSLATQNNTCSLE